MRTWKEIRAEAERTGRIDEAKVAEHRARMEAEIRANRLAEVRKRQHRTQVELAREMGVGQSWVSQIERGDLSHTELATLRAYVEALGGELRVVADFGDEQLIVA